MLYRDKFHLKRLEEKDLSSVKELFLKVFDKKLSLAYLKQKYNTSYLGIEYICSIAYEGDNPVAFYGALPQKFSKTNREIVIAHACDSFTLKKYQGQGLHFQLAKLSYGFMKQNDIKFVYAFHSENTFHSTKKLGWKVYTDLQRYHVRVNTLPLAKVLNKLKMNSFYKLFFSKEFSNETLVQLRTDHRDKFQQSLTSGFIQYKNNFVNHYFIESNGCILWVKIEAIMMVGLFYAPSELAFQKTIQKLKRKAFLLGITEILFQVHPKSQMASQLSSIVSPIESWMVGYLRFDPEIILEDFLFSFSDLDTF